MELLDRYLQAVKPLLPKEQRLDILAELSEDIQSQLDEKEAELGRPLTEPEQEAILDQYGPPIVVAGRYRANEGSFTFGKKVLIGSELFPFYMKALRLVLGITFLCITVIAGAMTIWKPNALSGIVSALFYWLTLQFVIQTVIWSSLQSHYTKYPHKWKAPKARPERTSPMSVRLESLVQAGVTLVILPWVHGALWAEHTQFGHGELAPVWHGLYFPVIGLMVLQVLHGLIGLVRPQWLALRAIGQAVLTALWLSLVGYLLASGPWVVLVDHTGNVAAHLKEVQVVNHYIFFYGLLATILGVTIQLGFEIWRIAKVARREAKVVSN